MSFPDYGASVEQVAAWIEETAGLERGRTMFVEPDLPPAPDRIASLFEIGGTWDLARGVQEWRLLLVTRAATLADARALTALAIQGALAKFKTTKPSPANIRALRLDNLPSLKGRDDRKRVILETPFILSVNADGDFGA